MTISSIFIGIIFLSTYYLFIRYLLKHKNILARPLNEQTKLKKSLYWGLIFAIVIFFGSQILIASKTTGWIPWLVISCYFLLWGFGGYLVWRAYRMGIKNELALVKKSNGHQFNNPSKFVRSIATVDLITGLLILCLAILIPILKIKLELWAPVIVVISSCKQIITSKFEKSDSI